MATEAVTRRRTTARPALSLRTQAFPVAVLTIALLPLLLSLPFLSAPMEQDEGVYFTVARHGWPYGAVFDHKPPIIYGWYKLAMLLSGGTHIEAVRLLAVLNISAAALAVAWTGATLFNRKTGIIAGLLMSFAVTNQYLQINANSEAFTLAPLALSLAAFVLGWRRSSLAWFAAAGVLAATATMTKTVCVLEVLALVGCLVWAAKLNLVQARLALRAIVVLASSGAAAGAIIVLPAALMGRWGDFWYANITYNRGYGAQVGFEDKLFALAEIDRYALLAGAWLWIPAAIGAVLLCRRGASIAGGLLIASLGAAFAGASATGREYPHYLVPMLPFTALLAAFAYERMTSEWSNTRARLHAEALLIVLAIPAIFAVIPLYVLSSDEVHLRVYHHGPNARRDIANDDLATYIAGQGGPNARLFVFGDESQLYALSGLTPATEHLRVISDAAVDAGSWTQTMRELQANPPEIVVDSARIDMTTALLGHTAASVTLDAPPDLREPFDEFLRAHYRFVSHTAYADVYARSD